MNRTLLALAVLFVACDGTEPTDDPINGDPITAAPTDEPTVEPDDTLWEDQTFGERQGTMAAEVLPAMTASFSAVNPVYENMNCGTCHGPGAADGSFAMPNADLLPIDPMNLPQGPIADFMLATVVPEMAALLDTTPFDPATGEGFGCLGCHPAAQ